MALTLLCGPALGAAVPDAGQTSRELQRQPDLNTPKPVTPLRSQPSAAPSAAANDVRLEVKAIVITGQQDLVPAGGLEALVADLIGAEHSLGELDAGAARITAYLRERGYAVARAYLPAQEIKNGVVSIRVLPGLVGHTLMQNQSRHSPRLWLKASGQF